MTYEERLQNVTVLGAAGKMGSGILLLTAVEMADLSLKPENSGKTFVLNAMDVSHAGLAGLMRYLKVQVLKVAEKKIGQLRKVYENRADLIENGEIIDQYVFDVMNVVRPVTSLEAAYESTLIFEAIIENQPLKVKLLSQIDNNNPHKPWVFTNTSSIPIKELEDQVKLDGRVLGFHFYNPPAVQKLVELIVTDKTKPELLEFAHAYAKNLKKIIVPSNDYAGFIGNGHFMRDALYGINEALRLSKEVSFAEAVYMVNKVTQDYLIRPMGIFQLVDYVGVDVVKFIMNVMNPYLKDEDLHSPLLDELMESGVKGGQNSDGSQKDGILKYEKGRVAGVYDPSKKQYVSVSDIQAKCDEKLGKAAESLLPWKAVVGRKDKDEYFKKYFTELKSLKTFGSELACRYANRSKEIGEKLVSDGVALKPEDVNTVLLTGFFHAYGPINNYLN
ncbi:MAG: 3-hydroxyacyl-CoA dehydrogenase family protein [Bacteroidota bacterium]